MLRTNAPQGIVQPVLIKACDADDSFSLKPLVARRRHGRRILGVDTIVLVKSPYMSTTGGFCNT
jgi:hypothetical protein